MELTAVYLTYLSTICGSLKSFVDFIGTACLIILVISAFLYFLVIIISLSEDHDRLDLRETFEAKRLRNSFEFKISSMAPTYFKWLFIIMVIFKVIEFALPDKKDVYVTMGAYVVTKAASTQTADDISSKSLAAIERWLDKQLKDKQADENKAAAKKEAANTNQVNK